MKSIAILVLVLQFPPIAVACSLLSGERLGPSEAYLDADVVMTGVLRPITYSWFDWLVFKLWPNDELNTAQVFEVSKAVFLKGASRDDVYVKTMQSGLCGPFLSAGDSLILYLNTPSASTRIYSVVLYDIIENLPAHMQDITTPK